MNSLICSDYGLQYESSQSTGKLMIALQPDITQIGAFPEFPVPFVKVVNTVKFKIQAEIQKKMIQGHSQSQSPSTPSKPSVTSVTSVTSAKRDSSSKSLSASKPSNNSSATASIPFESPKKKIQMDVTVDKSRLEKEMTPMKKNPFFTSQQTARSRKVVKGLVFRYQQGFTRAVRQAATINDFL